ncbi:Hypothetical predicted protein [Mytilus galloprovincialis]|uniref:Uncharacterized protein n=1 Tax=Mytilus galloprovincialis TaxID=29158 RepID=A0A8B6DS72_MYTGA|nr:Hypothetical predicted protein [Mytilus galloprovincialis]
MAHINVAVPMVYEERVINRFTIHPLEAVGWEGIFGFVLLGLLLIPFFHIDAGAFSELPTHKLDDMMLLMPFISWDKTGKFLRQL